MKNNLHAWGGTIAMCMPFLAAQAARTESPNAAPQLTYRSAFADYKPYKEAPLANWREVNDTVAGASGHAGHAIGGIQGTQSPTAKASAASAPMPMKPEPHRPMPGGHHLHGGKR